MIEDKLLIWKFKRGNSDALARIYEKYKNALLKLAAALLNDKGCAEDVVHDCFIAFAQSAETLKPAGNIKSYLATSVANRVRNMNRAAAVRARAGLGKSEYAARDFEQSRNWIVCSEDLSRLNNAIATLAYEQREVILLHVHGGMKFKAIAKMQGVSINTVQSRYRYGLEKLRLLLGSEAKL